VSVVRRIEIYAALLVVISLLSEPPPLEAAADSNPGTKTNDVPATLLKELRQAGYPKAASCRPCHVQIYNEWRLSSHAIDDEHEHKQQSFCGCHRIPQEH
jgi:hypothetical protein